MINNSIGKWAAVANLALTILVLPLTYTVLQNQWSSSKQLGEHSALLTGIGTNIDRLRTELAEQDRRLEGKLEVTVKQYQDRLASIDKKFDVAQNNPAKILLDLGVIKDGDVYSAFVSGGHLWVVPSPVLRKQLEREGRQLKRISSDTEIFGFQVIPVNSSP
jgi:hypothetical protein